MGDDNTYTITIGEADPISHGAIPNMTYTFHTSLTDTASLAHLQKEDYPIAYLLIMVQEIYCM